MRWKMVVLIAGLSLPLAGCFVSSAPLIDPATADFPFHRVTYVADGGERTTLVRDGAAYRAEGETDDVRILFKDYGDGLYLAEAIGTDKDGRPELLHGVVRYRPGATDVPFYRFVATPADLGPDRIPACPDHPSYGCLTDGRQFVDYVRGLIAAGTAPDGSFRIESSD